MVDGLEEALNSVGGNLANKTNTRVKGNEGMGRPFRSDPEGEYVAGDDPLDHNPIANVEVAE